MDDKKRSTDVDFGSMPQETQQETPQSELQTKQSQDLFQDALGLQNQKKFDESLIIYQKILDLGLADASNLTSEQASAVSQNMSLIYFQKKESALAYVYNQKAISLDPGNAIAIDFQKQNKNLFQTTSIPREISLFENINSMGLKYLSLEVLFAILTVLLFFVLKNMFAFFLLKKKADTLNEEAPAFKLTNYIWIFFFVCFSLLLFLKINDSTQLKVILKTATAEVQASAGENQAVVTQAEIGAILNVIKLSNDADFAYVQIKYPGAYSGWVKRTNLELLNATHWPVFIDKK